MFSKKKNRMLLLVLRPRNNLIDRPKPVSKKSHDGIIGDTNTDHETSPESSKISKVKKMLSARNLGTKNGLEEPIVSIKD